MLDEYPFGEEFSCALVVAVGEAGSDVESCEEESLYSSLRLSTVGCRRHEDVDGAWFGVRDWREPLLLVFGVG